jgi:hypothetical protein
MAPIYAIIERDGIGGLTEAELGLFAIYWFVLETNNGGIHQFFFNDSGQLAHPALACMERIGALRTADVFRRAIALFPSGVVPADQDERREVLNVMDDEGILFDPLTDELFTSGDDLAELHDAYIAANRQLFARLRAGAS